MARRKLSNWLTAPLVLGACGLLVWLERKRPLRRATENENVRDARNLMIAATAGATVSFIEKPVVMPLARMVEKRGWGLTQKLDLPAPLKTALAILLLDYTLYLWHVATHRVPFLWRFHLVHHVDKDLSALTALRFHFGELALSTLWRAAQVLVIGVTPRALEIWQTLLLIEILFQHSNARLPVWLEQKLVRLIVTPRMHGIHHSTRAAELNSNWSSGLTIWDYLHGTLRLDVPQETIKIGVAGYQRAEQLSLAGLLALPFERQIPTSQNLLFVKSTSQS